MARITETDLEQFVDRLNSVFGYKRKYVKSKAEYKGKAFDLNYAYGGVKLVVYGKTGSGIREVSGRGTKAEIYDYIDAMIVGVEMYKRRNK